MKGQVWLLNVWASWCVACRQEHPLLVDLAGRKAVPIIGLNYRQAGCRDGLADAARQPVSPVGQGHGRPHRHRIRRLRRAETFVIDKNGVIRYKQIGPITEEVWKSKMLPMLETLRKA